MRKLIDIFWYSLPVQLFVLHFRKYQFLLIRVIISLLQLHQNIHNLNKKFFKYSLYFTGVITIAIWSLLAWNYFNGRQVFIGQLIVGIAGTDQCVAQSAVAIET